MKIHDLIPPFINELKALNRSPRTVTDRHNTIKMFLVYLDNEKIDQVDQLTYELLADYQQHMAFKLTRNNKLPSVSYQLKHLCTIRGFTKFLYNRDYLVNDPGAKLQLPRKPQELPKIILSHDDIQTLFAAPDTRTNIGYRNRIILEILYDTGIRCAELASLKCHELDLKQGLVLIHGKGDKDRMVPLSDKVCELVQNYATMIRPALLKGHDPSSLIISYWGMGVVNRTIWAVVKQAVKDSGLNPNISTHTLRHTCATHMLKNGAPIRHIQEMLGHNSLETTQIYTRVTINDLKEVHSKYHPSENPKIKEKAENDQ